MRTYPKWVRKIKLAALYGGGGCFGLFVILVIVALVTSDNEKADSSSAPESPTATATAPESPSVVASGRAGATGADPAETEALRCDAPVNLFEAAESGTASEVKAALAAGADPGARDDNDNTPLHKAARNNANPAVIAALIEAGADPGARDAYDNTPLHDAASDNSNPAVIVALIEGGADPGARNERGATPFDFATDVLFNAAQDGPASEVKAALAAGADLGAHDKYDGNTPLHWAVLWSDNPSVIVALIEGGADPGARDNAGFTPFDYASDNDALKATDAYRMLKTDATDALFEAAESGTASEVKAALAAGANPAARDAYDNTPLHLAASDNSNPSVIAALIEGGADPGARLKHGGYTPLHFAAERNANLSVITALIEGGADPGAWDDDGFTPFDYAKDNDVLKGTDAYWLLNEARFE